MRGRRPKLFGLPQRRRISCSLVLAAQNAPRSFPTGSTSTPSVRRISNSGPENLRISVNGSRSTDMSWTNARGYNKRPIARSNSQQRLRNKRPGFGRGFIFSLAGARSSSAILRAPVVDHSTSSPFARRRFYLHLHSLEGHRERVWRGVVSRFLHLFPFSVFGIPFRALDVFFSALDINSFFTRLFNVGLEILRFFL